MVSKSSEMLSGFMETPEELNTDFLLKFFYYSFSFFVLFFLLWVGGGGWFLFVWRSWFFVLFLGGAFLMWGCFFD